MDSLSLIFSFIFGTIIGSFLNVVSLRFNTGTTLKGRSKCMSCGNTLSWAELVPLLSFIWQRGSCKKCKSKISLQYPLVEFIAGAVFVLIFFVFPPTTLQNSLITAIYLISSCLLLVIAVYDIKHKIIPDQFVYAFIIIAFASIFIGGETMFHMPSYSNLISGPLLAVPFALLWLVSRGTWMGLGDAKLILGIGWLLGLNGGINSVILSFWIASVISVIWLFVTFKRFKPKTEIPFGPYLIIGMYIVLFFNIQVIDINLLKVILLSYI